MSAPSVRSPTTTGSEIDDRIPWRSAIARHGAKSASSNDCFTWVVRVRIAVPVGPRPVGLSSHVTVISSTYWARSPARATSCTARVPSCAARPYQASA